MRAAALSFKTFPRKLPGACGCGSRRTIDCAMSPDRIERRQTMKSKFVRCFIAIAALVALALPIRLAAQSRPVAQNGPALHHHYKLIDLGTFGGPGSTPTEFQQMLNNQGTVVGGADTPSLNPYPNCFNPFNQQFECNAQHAFVWQGGKLTDLGTLPGGNSSFAYFISGNGLIAGGSEDGLIDPVADIPE